MMNCVKATRLISESLDRPLGRKERWGLRFHLLICRFCARYRRQIRLVGWLCSNLELEDLLPEEHLRVEVRERIKEQMRENLS